MLETRYPSGWTWSWKCREGQIYCFESSGLYILAYHVRYILKICACWLTRCDFYRFVTYAEGPCGLKPQSTPRLHRLGMIFRTKVVAQCTCKLCLCFCFAIVLLNKVLCILFTVKCVTFLTSKCVSRQAATTTHSAQGNHGLLKIYRCRWRELTEVKVWAPSPIATSCVRQWRKSSFKIQQL